MSDESKEPCVVAKCPDCGKVPFVATGQAINQHNKELQECVRDGLDVLHVTMAEFRKMKFGRCLCRR